MNFLQTEIFIGILLVGSTNAAEVSSNGIIGVHNAADLTTLVTPFSHMGSASNLSDNSLSTRVDTFNNESPFFHSSYSHSYIGATFTLDVGRALDSIIYHTTIFGDGGWFGSDSDNNRTGVALPTLQTTTDGGTTWSDLPILTSNYILAVQGIAEVTNPNNTRVETTFDFTDQTGVDGVRLIGADGGLASGGFIGGYEFIVNDTAIVPEPSAFVFALVGLGLMGRRRH